MRHDSSPPLLHRVAHVGRQVLVRKRLFDHLAAAQDHAVRRVLFEWVDRAQNVAPAFVAGGTVLGQVDHRVAGGIVLVDDALVGVECLRRLPADGVEDFFQDHRRGERPARIEQRGELAVLFLLLAVHAGVMDGHRGWDGKQRGAPLVCFAEAAYPFFLDEREAADHRVLEDERHSQRRELAPLVHEAAVDGILDLVVGVGLAVLPREDHPPVRRALAQAHARPHPGVVLGGHLTRPASRRDDGLGVGVVLAEVALPDVERLGDASGHRGQHVLEHDGRRD